MFTQDEKLGRTMDITMLGPKGAGKTSLLASLYDQFPTVVGTTSLEMSTTDQGTRTTLEGYRQDLRVFARGVQREPGIKGSENVREYLIGLGTRGKRPPQMTLRFTDAPGHVLLDTGPMRERLDRAVSRSAVLFIAVDSPALMERDGRYNDEINKPELVMEFVRDALGASGQRLIVFVPLKCERYVETVSGARELADMVKKRYASLVDHISVLSVEAGEARAGAVLTPVQTVGSMRFSRFDTSNEGVREVFRPTRLGEGYAPRDTDQPLRWMLRFVVNAYKQRPRKFGERFIDWWTLADVKLTDAMRQFGADCKDRDGFEVLVRHPYLELP
jgi:hypothetical protein